MASLSCTHSKERNIKEMEEKNETDAEREAREKEDLKRRLENRERAFIAASRRGDRTMEARFESALRASEVHKERTGKGLRITMEAVEREEMYDELDDEHGRKRRCHIDSLQLRSQSLDVHLHPYMLANFGNSHAGSPFPQLSGNMPNPYHAGSLSSTQGAYDPAMYRFNGVPGVEGMFNNPFSPSTPHGRPNSLPIAHSTSGDESLGMANLNGQNCRLNRRVASDPAIAVTHLHHAGSSPMRPESHPQNLSSTFPLQHNSQQQQHWEQHLEQTRQQRNDSAGPHSGIQQQLYQTVQQGSPNTTQQGVRTPLQSPPNIRRQSYQHIQQPRPRRLNTQYRANRVIRMNSFECMPFAHSPAINSPADGIGATGVYSAGCPDYGWGGKNSAVNSAATPKSMTSNSNPLNLNNNNCVLSGSYQEMENQLPLYPTDHHTPIQLNVKRTPSLQTPCHGASPVSRVTSAGSMTTSGSCSTDPSIPSPGTKHHNPLTVSLGEYIQNSMMTNDDLFPEEITGSEATSFFQDALPDVNGLELNIASHECADENSFLRYEFSDPFESVGDRDGNMTDMPSLMGDLQLSDNDMVVDDYDQYGNDRSDVVVV
ncbi:hypothetical protein ACJ72_06538 [Emergomyces africanus]|uniref:Uncharacterized protein n=1 Tax=Emergomyces africanus TaxID=1955775 RepID=A0A1B7NQN7_9EURO|nr:hypothetical protein ACJ72_06538 [Emergomyces africanus]